jgi:hypothetical protein
MAQLSPGDGGALQLSCLEGPRKRAFRFESRRARLANANLDSQPTSATGLQLGCNPVAVLAVAKNRHSAARASRFSVRFELTSATWFQPGCGLKRAANRH